MPLRQVVSWYPSWRHELVNDRCPMNITGTAGPIRTRDGSFDAPERRNDDGGVTWRCVPPGTCHVPPREPFEKCCVRVAAQTGSGREPKLSGQKRFGLNCVSMGESAPRGQNCAPKGIFIFFNLLPSSSDTLEPRDPKFGTRVHVSKGYLNIHNLGVQKLGGQDFGFLEFFDFFVFFFLSS